MFLFTRRVVAVMYNYNYPLCWWIIKPFNLINYPDRLERAPTCKNFKLAGMLDASSSYIWYFTTLSGSGQMNLKPQRSLVSHNDNSQQLIITRTIYSHSLFLLKTLPRWRSGDDCNMFYLRFMTSKIKMHHTNILSYTTVQDCLKW